MTATLKAFLVAALVVLPVVVVMSAIDPLLYVVGW